MTLQKKQNKTKQNKRNQPSTVGKKNKTVHSLINYGGLEHYRVKVAHLLKTNNSGFNEIIMLTEFYYYYYVLIEKGRRQYMTGREGPIPFWLSYHLRYQP
jgi:hypothetical protein